jgi:hypothetical protein
MQSPLESRPSLIVYTTCCHEHDRKPTYRLGLDLYEELIRPVDDPLAFGTSIPVFCAVEPGEVRPEAAETVVVVPVLGTTPFLLSRDAAMARIRGWHERLGPGHVLPLPVDPVWRIVEAQLPGKLLLTELYGEEPRRRSTVLEIVLAIARLWDKGSAKPALFVSHAKSDLVPSRQAAEKIAEFAKTSATAQAFFDRTDLFTGESLNDQIDFAVSRGAFVAVRGDTYSSRIWCQKELLEAKRNRLPTLTVEVLQRGERRSLAYGGNSPTIVWDRDRDDPGKVVARAMVEYVRAMHFRKEGKRAARAAGLPDDVEILARPPELLDMAQGPLRSGAPQLVMHPDPELPAQESQVLRAANPRLHLVTPLTAYRRVLSRESGLPGDAPLEGLQVAMSLSDSPDVDGPEGYTKHHVVDVTVHLARALISAGAAIAYGGDFRNPALTDPRRQGYTILLAELIGAYNQTAVSPAEFLHSYLPANLPLGEVPANLPMTLHHLVHSEDVSSDRVMPPQGQEPHPAALYISDMRRVMALKAAARVIVGGQSSPRREKGGEGYGGCYPGVVEEAWRSLEAGTPLYVVGGFGGASALVAGLLEGGPIPDLLRDATWQASSFFVETTKAIDEDPYRERLGLPRTQDDLAEAIKALGLPRLASDDASMAWNGLTVAENKALFRSRDPLLITALVIRGLLHVSRRASTGKLAIELVHGSVTAARELDAIAVATFNDVPLGGAGAALDAVAGGRATEGRAGGQQFISISRSGIEADWIYLASLGRLVDASGLEERIRAAARETSDVARRHGLRRVGVVAFGGTVLGDAKAVTGAMLDGLADLADFASVSWFESEEPRFEALRSALGSDPRVKLTTRRSVNPQVSEPAEQPLILQVSHDGGSLAVTILPPAGNAVAAFRTQLLTEVDVGRLAEGSGPSKRETPRPATLNTRGPQLAQLLFGEQADKIIGLTSRSKVVVVHDVPSSRIPFELMCSSTSVLPVTGAGMNRRLAVPGVPVEHLFARPPKESLLNVLLVIDPTSDLPGAATEGDAVAAILDQRKDRIKLTVLPNVKATKAALLAAFPVTDVLHYCGHAFFDGPGENESGLLLADGQQLTLADLRGAATPRVAIVNACEAGRVRGKVSNEAASFAEFFLRGGVESYVGTFWKVSDAAAQTFAHEVYVHLAEGRTLDQAVTAGRKKLHEMQLPDWANYILYGDGHFRLVAQAS